MAVNKVEITTENGTETLVDLTGDSVTPKTLIEGATAHGADGEIVVGENPYELNATNQTVNEQTTLISDIAEVLKGKAVGNSTTEGGGSEPLAEFSQMNPLVAQYMANVNYDSSNYSVSKVTQYSAQTVDYRKDQPASHTVTLEEAGEMGLCDGNRANRTDSVVGNNAISNLTPNKVHPWWNIANEAIKQCGTVKPTGQVRMIKLGTVHNVRDFGGWDCDGGTVKYGKLFRGGALNSQEAGVSITAEEIQMCRNLLGIRHEMDLRTPGEEVPTYSVLGEDIQYSKIPIGGITSNYALVTDLDGQYTDEMKAIISAIFESVKCNRPTYLHCTYGADRTGAVSFIINGLLGVSQSDLDKDYELTSFYSSRPRTASMYTGLIDYLKSCSSGNMRDCIVAWCVLLGISIDDINEFRRNMIDGNPSNVSANINYVCKGIRLSETSGTLGDGGTITVTAIPTPSWTTEEIVWTSSDTNIATVSGNGKTATIKGVGGGATTITATCGDYSATYTVTVESLLPIEYEAVEYIDNQLSSVSNISISAYCDLGITGRTGLVFKGKAMNYLSGDSYLFGSTNALSQRLISGCTSFIGTSGTGYYGLTRNLLSTDSTFEFNTEVNNSYITTYIPTNTVPNSASSIPNTTAFDNGVTMGLFCRNKSGTYERPYSGRLYWLTIEENGEEIMNLLPCRRKSDGVVGLYDTVGKQFLTSLNSAVPFSAPATI